MVRRWLVLLLVFCASLRAADVTVDVDVTGESSLVKGQMEAIVRITRPERMEVDANSFSLGGKHLDVEFLSESVRSSLTIVNGHRSETRSLCSSYRFLFPKGETGHRELPPVTMRIAGRAYASGPTSYFVCGTERSGQFRLEAFVRGKSQLYPGEKAEFVYRVSFRNPIETTDDRLPLLEAKGFRRLGERSVTHDFQGKVTQQEICQEVQALEPGRYEFEASYVEGYPYRKDFFGHRTYERRKLKADAPPVVVTVCPFPTEGRPDAFSGALGTFSIETRLLSPSEVTVGDRVRLEVTLKGDGDLSTVHCPNLKSQEPFSRLFRISDLPPTSEEKEGQKSFIVEMRPLSAVLTQVPAICFASFDPKTGRYVETMSKALPLRVTQLQAQACESADPPPAPEPVLSDLAEPSNGAWRAQWEGERESRIVGCYGEQECRLEAGSPPWYWLSVLPAGFLASCAGAYGRRLKRRRRQNPRRRTPREQLRFAESLDDLERALIRALQESGRIDGPCLPDSLPTSGVAGEVRAFLLGLHAASYAEGQSLKVRDQRRSAEELLHKILKGAP